MKFYKFLVRRIVAWDKFAVFKDYCSATTGIPEELKAKIVEVKNLVDELLNGDLKIHEKYSAFNDFVDEHGVDRFNP